MLLCRSNLRSCHLTGMMGNLILKAIYGNLTSTCKSGPITKICCKNFQRDAYQNAASCYKNLPDDSINSWDELMKAFLCHYIYNTESKIDNFDLQAIKQRYDESLKKFFNRWKNTLTKTQDVKLNVIILAFAYSLFKTPNVP